MIRVLPFILVPVLILGGLWIFRNLSVKQTLSSPKTNEQIEEPVEVPKTLPGATIEDRVKSLEDTITKLVPQINTLKSSNSQSNNSTSSDSRIANAEAAVTDLKARVSALEKATPVPVSASSQSTVYIPLGAGGSWTDLDWNSLAEYEVSLNPSNYPGYTGMSLEVNFRMVESAGTASVRLYSMTDNSAVSSELNTTSTSFTLKTSSSFKLSSGTKTYRLQVKSSKQKEVFIQSARIKVSF